MPVSLSTKTSLFTAERSPLLTMASMRAQGGCEKADTGTEAMKPQGEMKAKGRAADTEVEFLEMKWSAGQDSHHLCLWPAESVLSSPAGRWRWTVLLWSILVQSPGRSSCTGPSWLWIVPEWERKRRWSEEEKSSDSLWRSWGTDRKWNKSLKHSKIFIVSTENTVQIWNNPYDTNILYKNYWFIVVIISEAM